MMLTALAKALTCWLWQMCHCLRRIIRSLVIGGQFTTCHEYDAGAQEPSIVTVMQAVISPRTLHELCKAAQQQSGAAGADLQASACGSIITHLLAAGSLLSLRNLVLARFKRCAARRVTNCAPCLPQPCATQRRSSGSMHPRVPAAHVSQ
jgi:hypothetical protein